MLTVFDQRHTPILYNDAYPPYASAFGQFLMRPVYYHFLSLISYPGGVGPANGLMFSPLAGDMDAALVKTGIWYGWNFDEGDSPGDVGGFYHGTDSAVGYSEPLVFTNWGQVQGLMVAGADKDNALTMFYQFTTGGV